MSDSSETPEESFSSTLGWIALSVGCSVTVVLANKAVFTHFAVSCATSLTALHFLFSTITLSVAGELNFFEKKYLPFKENMEIALLGVLSIVCMNLSLHR